MGVFEQSFCIIVLIVDLVEVELTLSCDGPEFDSLASDSGLAVCKRLTQFQLFIIQGAISNYVQYNEKWS